MQHDEQLPYKFLIPINKNILEMKVLLRCPLVYICNAIVKFYKIIILIMNQNVELSTYRNKHSSHVRFQPQTSDQWRAVNLFVMIFEI